MAPSSSTTEDSARGPPAVSATLSIVLVLVLVFAVYCARRFSHLQNALEARAQLQTQQRGSLRSRGLRQETLDTFPIVKYDREFGKKHQSLSRAINLRVLPRHMAFCRETKQTTSNDNDEDHASNYATDNANDGPETNADRDAPRNNAPKSTANSSRLRNFAFWSRSCKSPPTEPPPGQDKDSCAICTEGFVDGVDVLELPCQHIFHPPCIDIWLMERSATCPLCRIDLRPAADESDLPKLPRGTAVRREYRV